MREYALLESIVRAADRKYLKVKMLKWLVTGREEGSLPTITEDPLATIPRAKKDRKNEIYSVNR